MKKPSKLIPEEYRGEIFALSKAALADILWDIAACQVGSNCKEAVMIYVRASVRRVAECRGDRYSPK